MTRSATLLVAALSLVACRNIEGGPEVSETRSLDAFTRVRIEDGIPATISPGKSEATVNAPEKVVANLETVVKSGTLIVRMKPNVSVTSFDGTEVVITTEGLLAVEASGGSPVTVSGVTESPFRATASGGSQLSVTGTTADARLNASGGSGIAAEKLTAELVSVEATGGSTIELTATKSVEGIASGGSRVTISGGGDSTNVSASGGSLVSGRN
ncbi:MAG: DUF2807 domain-containing protein [Archangium sp.]|nr:DUF2807 domain-containing protein [Archangium sp.]MDP3154044.1 DUF2807 domain-containing protein [Archangium sp.]MDP3570053.1 DUF2807 domain-containing protein [Archangium sp.]